MAKWLRFSTGVQFPAPALIAHIPSNSRSRAFEGTILRGKYTNKLTVKYIRQGAVVPTLNHSTRDTVSEDSLVHTLNSRTARATL